jgi:hypothetical protein
MDDATSNESSWDTSPIVYDDDDREWSYGETADRPSLLQQLIPRGFLEWFVISQTAIPGALYLPGSQAFRLPLRIGAYAIAFVGFMLWFLNRSHEERERHPSQRWLLGVLLYLFLMIFHPLTSGLTAGVAQTLLYFAIFSAVFWAPAFVDRPQQLVRLLAIMLICNGINSLVGVLQVYNPDRFMPSQLSLALSRTALQSATYIGPDGRPIMRPPGLFDTPGAVCGPGAVAALLGLVFAIEQFAWWKRAVALMFSLAGISAIYLSHVRASFVVALGMMAVYAAALLFQNQKFRLTAFTTLAAGIVVLGLAASTVLGGEGVRERFSTLLGDDPRSLYYKSRGQQVETGFNELANQYPFGAGLARWGMMHGYFGDRSKLESTEIWAEVQTTVWMLDGGFPLLILYVGALAAAAWYEWRLAMRLLVREDRYWAATVAAVNIGTLALVFSFVPFVTQVGLQFWFLEGALHGAMAHRSRRP